MFKRPYDLQQGNMTAVYDVNQSFEQGSQKTARKNNDGHPKCIQSTRFNIYSGNMSFAWGFLTIKTTFVN